MKRLFLSRLVSLAIILITQTAVCLVTQMNSRRGSDRENNSTFVWSLRKYSITLQANCNSEKL